MTQTTAALTGKFTPLGVSLSFNHPVSVLPTPYSPAEKLVCINQTPNKIYIYINEAPLEEICVGNNDGLTLKYISKKCICLT
jgi:hypothetical protein